MNGYIYENIPHQKSINNVTLKNKVQNLYDASWKLSNYVHEDLNYVYFGSGLLLNQDAHARALELDDESLIGERPVLNVLTQVKAADTGYVIQLRKSFIYKIEESLKYDPF